MRTEQAVDQAATDRAEADYQAELDAMLERARRSPLPRVRSL